MAKYLVQSELLLSKDIEVKSYKFLIMSIFLFPVILLIILTFQPRVMYNKESIFYLLSTNILYIHLIIFLLLVIVFINKIGKVSLADLGLNKKDFVKSLWLIPIVWLLEQIFLLGFVFFTNYGIKINEVWLDQNKAIKELSYFVANTIATGLNEESFFRGFLFLQFFHHFKNNFIHNNKLKAFLFAAFFSSVVFSLCHLQFNLVVFAFLIVGGLIGVVIYVLTNNLFYGIILHGFFNSPLPLIESSDGHAKLSVLLVIGIVVMTDVLIKSNTHRYFNKNDNSLLH